MGEGGVDVAHEDLGVVTTTGGNRRLAVTSEVEPMNRAGPRRHRRWHVGGRALAQPVQQEKGATGTAA